MRDFKTQNTKYTKKRTKQQTAQRSEGAIKGAITGANRKNTENGDPTAGTLKRFKLPHESCVPRPRLLFLRSLRYLMFKFPSAKRFSFLTGENRGNRDGMPVVAQICNRICNLLCRPF